MYIFNAGPVVNRFMACCFELGNTRCLADSNPAGGGIFDEFTGLVPTQHHEKFR